jgi:hypothetical protein
MLLELERSILEYLTTYGIQVQSWSGKSEDLFLKPKTYPAVRVIIESVNFTEKHSPTIYDTKVDLSFLIFFRSLREKGQGAYTLIENILNLLCGKTFSGFDLRVQNLSLLYQEAGDFCYQLKFAGYGKFTVDYTEEEPITRRITTYEGENQESDIFSEYYQGG